MSLKPEFAALLRNNDIPSESAIREVKEALKTPFNELREIEVEIQRLCDLVETLKIERQGVQRRIDDYNVILSPVRRLPVDVLHEIFFRCLPTHRNPTMQLSEAPVLLTRICSSWRAIALSSPRIWSKIHIPLPGYPSFSREYGTITDETSLSNRRQRFARILRLRCGVVQTWLSRSGTCPLSLSIVHPGPHSGTQNSKDDELPNELFSILLSSADRWSDVDLSMPEDIYIKLQGDMKPTAFPSLKSLKLNLSRHFSTDIIPLLPIQLLAAPRLCNITMNSGQLTFALAENAVQPIWIQLTHITFAFSISDKYLLPLLSQCPNLVFGKFMVTFSSPKESTVYRGDVLLPCLDSLAINNSGGHETMAIIFDAIKAPALTKLEYQWFDRRVPDQVNSSMSTPVIPLLSNSTLITHLSLIGDLSSQDTEEILRRGERITHIVFKYSLYSTYSPFHTPPFDQDLVPPDPFDLKLLLIGSSVARMAPLIPRLEFLEAHDLARLTDEDLFDLIVNRINAFKRGETAALKYIKIRFQRPRQKDITEAVSRYAREAGVDMKLDLTYAPETPRYLDDLSPSFGLPSNDL